MLLHAAIHRRQVLSCADACRGHQTGPVRPLQMLSDVMQHLCNCHILGGTQSMRRQSADAYLVQSAAARCPKWRLGPASVMRQGSSWWRLLLELICAVFFALNSNNLMSNRGCSGLS